MINLNHGIKTWQFCFKILSIASCTPEVSGAVVCLVDMSIILGSFPLISFDRGCHNILPDVRISGVLGEVSMGRV